MIDSKWEMVIGLEVHVELQTETKLFCACPNRFGAEPNTLTCPGCLGLPGTLPTLNGRAVELHLRAARALECKIHEFSKFDRKHYFYPDISKSFQTSQDDLPVAYKGWLELSPGRVIGITRIHLEEDAGKSTHLELAADGFLVPSRLGRSDCTHIDYNRAGVPLLEIVSEPDLREAQEAYDYVEKLRELLLWLQISDCKMEHGSLRCDANVSMRRRGETGFGVKTEIKNMNSLRSIRDAIESERLRQIEILESGGEIVQETRGWDETTNSTISMREKVGADDYRFFPDPNLCPLRFDVRDIALVDEGLPEFPAARRERYTKLYDLDQPTLDYLTIEPFFGRFFERTIATGADATEVAKWMVNTISRLSNEKELELADSKLTPESLGGLLKMIESGDVGAKSAQRVLETLFVDGGEPDEVVDKLGLRQLSSADSLTPLLKRLIEENPAVVAEFLEGKGKALNVLVGKVMKETKGAANPALTRSLLEEMIGEA